MKLSLISKKKFSVKGKLSKKKFEASVENKNNNCEMHEYKFGISSLLYDDE